MTDEIQSGGCKRESRSAALFSKVCISVVKNCLVLTLYKAYAPQMIVNLSYVVKTSAVRKDREKDI